LLLAAVDVSGRDRWRWLLTDEDTGVALAVNTVEVDRRAAEWAGFTDLYGWVKVNADPGRRITSGTGLVDRVGRWITRYLLGEAVVAAIAARAPTTVRVQVPDELGFLRLRPLELAHHNGTPLAATGEIAFVYQLTDIGSVPAQRPGTAEQRGVRMVAVFSQPDRTSMLALRRERYELTRLVRRLAATTRRAIDLEVLQYGVTRQILTERIAAKGGCDLLHISAHGRSDALLLEKPDGTPDPVSTDELVRLLKPVRRRVKLAVVSACESAAASVTETLHWLNIDTTTGGALSVADEADVQPAAGLASRIGLDLECAVVAMRYPVVDEFAIGLADRLYHNLFQQQLPLETATCRAVADAVDRGPGLSRPPVSVATPALLTASPDLAGLRFDPPKGSVDFADLRLVGFPDEPERFVGRAAAMARATTALAPDSGSTAVLFHGMAGAGKTACALELAYRHRDTFADAVFWQAPLHDDQWAGALTDLAFTLERQLGDRGFAMVDKIGTAERFAAFLPGLRRLLTDTGLLLVLDNLETLLTPDGQWRDPRWADLIDALIRHGGVSRVVLTSRTRPAGLDPGVVVLPVHALYLDETVLLARELPHLGRLLHADGSNERTGTGGATVSVEQVERDRALVRRTLTVVQGHPKLLELADAAARHPDQLAAHLGAAEAVSDAGRLAAFLTHGDSSLDPDGFLAILTGWTESTLHTLPEPARLLLHALCAIEDDDRISPVVGPVWPVLWTRLHPDADPPPLGDAVARLATAALIHTEPQPAANGEEPVVRYRIHPGVADTVHTATSGPVVAATRRALADFWYVVYTGATNRQGGEHTPTVVRAGLAAAPYLLALSDYGTAAALLERAVRRDQIPAAAQAALPHLRRIAEATGSADDLGILARVLTRIDPGEAEQLMRDVLRRADEDGDHRLASSIASDLINLLQRSGRLAAALDLADTLAGHTRQAGLGPWTQFADEVRRLQIMYRMGHIDQVLTEALHLRDRMAELPDQQGDNDIVLPWNVRETLLNLGAHAATDRGRWQTALDLAHEEIASLQQRGASNHDIAYSRFNTYRPLVALGRVDQAEQVLLACQQVFEDEQDITRLANAIGARADLAFGRGHHHDGAALLRTAIRLLYVQPQPLDVAVAHSNLAVHLAAEGSNPAEVIGHHLAGTLLGHLIGDSHHTASRLRGLAARLQAAPDLVLPATLADLASVVERVEGVRYAALVAVLTGGNLSLADQGLADLIHTARSVPPATSTGDLGPQLAAWEPVLAALTAASRGDSHATRLLTEFFDRYATHPDWAALVDRLRLLHTGERDPDTLLLNLDPIGAAVVQRALDALAGRIQLDSTGPEQPAPQPANGGGLDAFIDLVAAAAAGTSGTTTALTPTLDAMAAEPVGAVLADRIRRIIAGERDADQLSAGVHPAAAPIIAAILDRLAPPPPDVH
jgi:hypothetical protein